jgi:hypothetical protein
MTMPTVFISYSHKDEIWKNRLVTHLGVLQQEGLLDLWDDRRIGAGEDWYQKIEEAIAKARVAVLLVSADFLTSNFILSEEVPRLLERKDKEGLRIFPVIIRPCAWKHVKWLTRMNLRPRDGKPISSGDEHQIDADLAAIADEVAAIIESKNPKTPLETSPTTAPEKISIPQLQSTDFDLYGHEMKPEIPPPEMLRIQHLADNIQKDLDLLKEYEDVLRLEDDPRRRARYRREIEQLRESAASYKMEYDELLIQITGKPTVAMQNVGDQLHQMDAKLSTLLVGQIKIQDTLVNLRRTVLARFDVNEQTIITTIVDHLDQEQLIDTQNVLDSIATRQFAENELHETLVAVRDTLNEIRQKETFLSDSHLTSEIEKLSDVVDAPKLDVSHKLKITVPIIPFILSYEGEMALKTGMNLESAWHRLLSKVRR